jgi:hypothetical protein
MLLVAVKHIRNGFTSVRRKRRHKHQCFYLVVPHAADNRARISVTDKNDRTRRPLDDRRHHIDVVIQTRKRNRRAHRVKPCILKRTNHLAPARTVSPRAMHHHHRYPISNGTHTHHLLNVLFDRRQLLLDHAELLQQCQVVLEMPVLHDLSILDTVKIECLKIDFLSASLNALEFSGEVPFEMQVEHRTVADHRHIVDVGREVRNRRPDVLRRLQRAFQTWRPARRLGPIDKVVR